MRNKYIFSAVFLALLIFLGGYTFLSASFGFGTGDLLEKSKSPQIISIGMMGDVMLGRMVDSEINTLKTKNAERAFKYPWGNTLSILKKNHLNLINLETAITNHDQAVPKVFNFKASPSNIKILKEGSIGVVNLANNHVLDFGEKGLIDTLATLKANSVAYVGAGKNIEEARSLFYTELHGARIGIVGMTDNEPTWLAGVDKAGTNYVQVGDEVHVKDWIQKAKSRVDLLILSVHWGPNNRERPLESFKRFAHFLIDNGVDIIHGHSAHIFQGVENYKHGLVIYDSGDFIDDYYVDPILRNDRSFLFVVELQDKRWHRLIMYPVFIDRMQVNLVHDDNAKAAMARMVELSQELGTDILAQPNFLEILNKKTK